MKIFWSIEDAGDEMKRGAVAIGNFDGVHLGHQALIERTISLKGKSRASVLTFTPHPNELLKPNEAHFYLTSDRQKIRIFSKFSLDIAVIHRIDRDFLNIEPHDFVQEILVKKLKVKHVVVGDDFTFGKKALGDISLMRSLGEQFGFLTHVIKQVSLDEKRCSSSAIRSYLRLGDLEAANKMLNRQFSILGDIKKGQGLGKTLGFNTANLIPPDGFGLVFGIYASVVRVYDGEKYSDHVSATSVGVRPTVTDDKTVVVESHLLDVRLDLCGRIIEVFFVERLRDEIKFQSLTALQEQVQKDCQRVRQMYRANPHRFQVAS